MYLQGLTDGRIIKKFNVWEWVLVEFQRMGFWLSVEKLKKIGV